MSSNEIQSEFFTHEEFLKTNIGFLLNELLELRAKLVYGLNTEVNEAIITITQLRNVIISWFKANRINAQLMQKYENGLKDSPFQKFIEEDLRSGYSDEKREEYTLNFYRRDTRCALKKLLDDVHEITVRLNAILLSDEMEDSDKAGVCKSFIEAHGFGSKFNDPNYVAPCDKPLAETVQA